MFSGSITALITPFTMEGEVDYASLEHLIDWQIKEGSDALLCGGTTGEGVSLSDDEYRHIIQTAIRVSNNRVPIIVGTGTSNTRTTVAKTEMAQKLGAAGCLVVVPYYSCPTPEGCIAHYRAINQVQLPIILYHHPKRTGTELLVQTLVEICSLSHVVALKEASGNMELAEVLLSFPHVFILSGNDHLAYRMIQMGAKGSVSVIGNIIPAIWKQMVSSVIKKEFDRALEWDNLCAPLYRALMLEPNPQGIKYGMNRIGKALPYLRLPLLLPKESTRLAIEAALSQLLSNFTKRESSKLE